MTGFFDELLYNIAVSQRTVGAAAEEYPVDLMGTVGGFKKDGGAKLVFAIYFIR
tara:strand:- start:162 stop:323 length:162 start_codon:yes stop_codon:yes gene_type:complete